MSVSSDESELAMWWMLLSGCSGWFDGGFGLGPLGPLGLRLGLGAIVGGFVFLFCDCTGVRCMDIGCSRFLFIQYRGRCE